VIADVHAMTLGKRFVDRRARQSPVARISLLIAALLCTVSVAGCGHTQRAPATSRSGPQRYTDPAGWSLSYPRTMYLERSSSGPGLASFSEVTIASFPQRRAVHSGRTRDGGFVRIDPPLNANGAFPNDGVAVRMVAIAGGPAPIVTVPDSRFPIELGTFRAPQYPDYSKKGVPSSIDRPIEADGQRYAAIAVIGPRAPAGLRAALGRVIASLSFPPPRPGTEIGNGLTVLQPATSYPVDSFTLVHAPGAICGGDVRRCRTGGAPFYLVRAPGRLHEPDLLQPCTPPGSCSPAGAFYAIGWTWEDVLGGYRSRCDLRLDRRRQQFFCTNLDARWDRVGRVITRPPGARFSDPLQFAFAKIAWDGHVVMVPGIDENPPRPPAAHALWPGWHTQR
jgi:hypothetical protein